MNNAVIITLDFIEVIDGLKKQPEANEAGEKKNECGHSVCLLVNQE
jgi:hypothetical protein